MKKLVVSVFVVMMVLGLVKGIVGDFGENLERQVDGVTYIIIALCGFFGLQLDWNQSLKKRLDDLEQKQSPSKDSLESL